MTAVRNPAAVPTDPLMAPLVLEPEPEPEPEPELEPETAEGTAVAWTFTPVDCGTVA